MKKIYQLSILLIVMVFFTGCTTQKEAAPTATKTVDGATIKETPKKEESMTKYNFPGILPDEKIKNKKAVIKTSKGTVEFDLYADKAPKTVSNFVYLAELGYYNGLNFHRVVPGFVIQGGDPTGTGAGGPGYKFEDEAVVGDYKAGTVAMANSGPDTNGSQFFICIDDQPGLPKLYSLFGQVTVGQDIVKKIAVGDKIESIVIANK
jgi:cyclophilin family peptidyl-prolyl cis-trans isomerase